MLQNEWRALLSNLESVKEDYYNYSEQPSCDPPLVEVTMEEYQKMKSGKYAVETVSPQGKQVLIQRAQKSLPAFKINVPII